MSWHQVLEAQEYSPLVLKRRHYLIQLDDRTLSFGSLYGYKKGNFPFFSRPPFTHTKRNGWSSAFLEPTIVPKDIANFPSIKYSLAFRANQLYSESLLKIRRREKKFKKRKRKEDASSTREMTEVFRFLNVPVHIATSSFSRATLCVPNHAFDNHRQSP